MRVRGAHLVLALALAATSLVGAPVAGVAPERALAAGAFADPHFRESTIVSGLVSPTSIVFGGDGRMFVAEKRGIVKAFDSITDSTPTTVLDVRAATMNYWDRGLLGLALDPAFLVQGAGARPYLYAYYVYDAPPGQTAPVWNDQCPGSPNGPGATTDGCVVTSKLVRFTIDRGTNVAVAGSEVELLHDWCSQFPSHAGGGMAFGDDGQLYLSVGDGASFTVADYGQKGGTVPSPTNPITPVNPCADPVAVTSPAGTTPVVDVATAEGGSLRAQDLRTPGDPVTLDGTLIRIDPDTGAASSGNPLAGAADANARRIIAHGFRNPFRLTKQPGTGDLYVGDVGNVTWEEVNRVVPPSGGNGAVRNYGWPCYEGGAPGVPWNTMGVHLCDNLYAEGSTAVRAPAYAYSHVGAQAPCGSAAQSNASISGLAFYEAGAADQVAYPARYDGALFFVDYSRNCLAVLRPGSGGMPDPSTAEVVATGLGHPVDLVTGPHGDLYYADLDGGAVTRIRYAPSPVAHATVTPPAAVAPVTVTLDASTSLDPDPEAALVAWDWDLDHDGTFDGPADQSGKVVHWDIGQPGVYPFTLRVTSSNGFSDTLALSIDTTNDPPVPHIDAPPGSLAWSAGDDIDFSGSATDREDGDLPASALDWSIVLMHCVEATCHEHVLQTPEGVAGGSFQAPDHEYPSHLELRLTATDSDGASATTSLELQPRTTTLQVASLPSGVPIAVGNDVKQSPSSTTLIRGGTTSVVAPAVWTSGATRYRFGSWDDGLARSHEVTVVAPASRTATYVPDAPDACSSATSIAAGSWITERASGGGDADWFRFRLSAKRRVVVTLGDLPVNARLELFGACSTRLATVDHAGTSFERLNRVLAAGTYRVRVTVPSGASSPSPYALRVFSIGRRAAIESRTTSRSGGTLRVVGSVINATGATTGRVAVTATYRDAAGRIVGTLRGATFSNRLGDGAQSPFVLAGPVPAYTSVAFGLVTSSPGGARHLVLRSLTSTPTSGGRVTETGSVRNDGTTTTSNVQAARAWFGRRGEILDLRTATVTPSTLRPRATGSFSVLRPALGTVQAARTLLRGS